MTPTDGPLHVAIIMDGNGRWAKQRGLPRTFGHREGVKALKRTVEAASKDVPCPPSVWQRAQLVSRMGRISSR